MPNEASGSSRRPARSGSGRAPPPGTRPGSPSRRASAQPPPAGWRSSGTSESASVSLPDPAGELNVVAIGMVTEAVAGSATSVLVRVKLTVVSPPGASGPYGFEVASAVMLAGRVRLTSPLWVAVDQLWTSTGTVRSSGRFRSTGRRRIARAATPAARRRRASCRTPPTCPSARTGPRPAGRSGRRCPCSPSCAAAVTSAEILKFVFTVADAGGVTVKVTVDSVGP